MTICMGALCTESGSTPNAVVVASDRMVTMGGLIEFEHAVPKVTRAGGQQSVVLVAGDALGGSRLIQTVLAASSAATVAALADELAKAYQAMRRDMAESQVLGLRGLTMADFYGKQAQLSPQLAVMIDQQLQQFNLGIELLVAGVDGSGGHLYTIHHPGGAYLQHDVIGYAAIGSGALHAVQSMIGFGHTGSAPLLETVFRVHASKRRAEVAPGVGRDTDLLALTPSAVTTLGDKDLATLDEVYAQFTAAATVDLTKKLSTLNFDKVTEKGVTS